MVIKLTGNPNHVRLFMDHFQIIKLVMNVPYLPNTFLGLASYPLAVQIYHTTSLPLLHIHHE